MFCPALMATTINGGARVIAMHVMIKCGFDIIIHSQSGGSAKQKICAESS